MVTLSRSKSAIIILFLAFLFQAVGGEVLVIGGGLAEQDIVSLMAHPPRGASYIIIVPEDYLASVMPLARLRQSLNHEVACVTVEAICLYLPGRREVAIQRFIQHACSTWPSPRPRFLLLAADVSAIPTWYVKDYENRLVATDYPYSEIPEATDKLLIGRLPAKNAAELDQMVAKILQYEQDREGGLWQRRISFVAGEGGFGKIADALLEDVFRQLLSSSLPPSCDVTVSYASPSSEYFYPASRFPELVAFRLNEGSLFFVYVGHGDKDSLGRIRLAGRDYPIFSRQHLSLIRILKGMPVMVSLACCTGDFGKESLGMAMVKMRHGPVAFIGASQISHPYGNILVGKAFLEGAFEQGTVTIGELLEFVRMQLLNPPPWDIGMFFLDQAVQYFADEDLPLEQVRKDHVYMYNLLGDPALRIFFPQPFSEFQIESPKATPCQILVRGKAPEGLNDCELVVTLEIPMDRILSKELWEESPLVSSIPSDMSDPSARAYWQANHKVLAYKVQKIEGNFAVTLDLKRPLHKGEYRIKVAILGPKGAAAGCRILKK